MTASELTISRASAPQKLAVSAALTFMASTGGPLTAATISKDGTFSYNVASVPLIAEVAKLITSIILLTLETANNREHDAKPSGEKGAENYSIEKENGLCPQENSEPRRDGISGRKSKLQEGLLSWHSTLVFFPPSLLFIIVNNLRIWNLRYIDPASAGLLATLRIALTAILLRCFLQRSFSRSQWASVLLLSFSVAWGQMDGARFEIVADLRRLIGTAILAFCSALASVYMEWALKGNFGSSMHVQNAQIYGWGVLLNGFVYLSTRSNDVEAAPRSLIQGYTPLTWILILHLACSGLIIAWLLKHADSITKIHATSASLFLTAVISAAWLGTHVSVNLMVGIALSSMSMFLYHGLLLPPFFSASDRNRKEETTPLQKYNA